MPVSEEIRGRIEGYVSKQSGNPRIDEDLPTAIVSYGKSHGVPPVQDVDSLKENLPELSERLQELAFQVALAPYTVRELADLYNVSPAAISRWLSSSDVQAHIAVYRYERHMLAFAKGAYLQNLAYDAITRILKMRLTATTTETVAKTALKVLESDYSGMNGAVNMSSRVSQSSSNLNSQDRTPITDKNSMQSIEGHTSISSIEEELEEVKTLKDAIGRNDSE